MKTKFTNQELPHIWMRQTQDTGTGSNMFFEDETIYSYGYHFPIASINERMGTVLFTSKGYSNTTAKHKLMVQRAISGGYFTVENVLAKTKEEHQANLDGIIKELVDALDSSKKARENRFRYLNKAQSLGIVVNEYARVFDLGIITHSAVVLSQSGIFQEEINKALNETHERENARNAKKVLKEQEAMNKWLAGEDVRNYFTETRLRIKDGRVETSKGASVSVEKARILARLIAEGQDVVGHDIEGYIVIALNGVLKIGCHNIPRQEVERILPMLLTK